jgi:hypothetical protein
MKNIVAVSCLLATFGVASAEAPAATERKVAPSPKPAAPAVVAADRVTVPPPVETPKPPAEVATLAKTLGGKLKCTGTSKDMNGADQKVTVVVKSKVDLDKWWIADTIEVTMGKTKDKMVSYTTYDAKSSKWRRVAVGTGGAQTIGTSDGLKDGKLVFTMDTTSAMGSAQMRETTDITNPKAPTMIGEMSMDKGKTWIKGWEVACKR